MLDMLYIIGLIPINCPVFYEINWTFYGYNPNNSNGFKSFTCIIIHY